MSSHFNRACTVAARYANRHGRDLARAEKFLARAGYKRATFGVEHVECAGRELSYLNSGDTYSATVCQEGRGELFVSTWGDWYEDVEREHCEEEGAIRCGYCGDFTPCADDWRETRCEHCGRNVSSGQPMAEVRDEDE